MSQMPAPKAPFEAGYYDSSDLAAAPSGPHPHAAEARSLAVGAGIAADSICVFRWNDLPAVTDQIAQQRSLDAV